MDAAVNEAVAVVREFQNAASAFQSLRAIAARRLNAPFFADIPEPGVEMDVWELAGWLGGWLDEYCPAEVCVAIGPRGDRSGDRINVSMSMIVRPDPAEPAEQGLVRYAKHRVKGLNKIQSAYKATSMTALADQIFFLGYGGVVLLAALERLKNHRDCLFVWGIDDGPYGKLARTSPSGVQRIVAMKIP